ncbi:MAG TPA: hypothetical protein VN181_12865, partial [Thermoanaerobaculia bacterium]|nr:hypothetical protein [Thermoanaerobaculia bacterium]
MKALVAVAVVLAVAASALGAAPVLVSLDPPAAVAGTLTSLTLTVNGANFTQTARIRVDGVARQTALVSTTQLTTILGASDLDREKTLRITVTTTTETSGFLDFKVLPNDPRITSIDPSVVAAGSGQFTLRVVGTNFATTAKVRVNGTVRETRSIDDKTLEGTILGSDIASPVNLNITVANPNNKVSNIVVLQSTRGTAAPVITLLSPDRVTAGGNDFTLTVIGRNFDRNAVVRLDGVNATTTTFVSSEQLTARILKSQYATPKTIQISVLNPSAPASATLPLTVISEKLPILDTIAPISARAGSGALQLIANGASFINGSVIRVDGVQQATTFVSANRLTTTLTASQLSVARDLRITVFTPGADGGESQAKTFTVVAADAPTITATNPTTITAGSTSRTFIVFGTGFADGDQILVNGAARPTIFNTSSQLVGTFELADIAGAATLQIQVKKKLGGATSAPFELRVVAAEKPSIDTLAPAAAEVGGDPFVLTINGFNFASGAIVSFDGEVHASTFVSATRITVSVTAADLVVARNIAVRVTNPDGTVSDAVELPVIVIPPVLSSVDPASVAAGDPGFTLSVTGTKFSSGATIDFDGVARQTTFNAATNTLSTVVRTSDVSVPRTILVTVSDNGARSNALPLSVLRPAIVLVDPPFAFAGSGDVNVTVSGTSFLPTSKVEFKGGERPTNF